jgi:ABC-type dipeptide/oligopeptide/nickel transport system ATPase subunit
MVETRKLTRRFYTRCCQSHEHKSESHSHDHSHFAACEDVSIHIAEGEIFGLVGESGCGKSTLANMLLLLIKPCEGEIHIDGQNVTNLSRRRSLMDVRRKIQYVPQNSGSSLNPHMTLEGIITEPMRNFKIPHKSKAAELLEIVGLSPDWIRRRPAQLSGGQRQRVAVARAISINPQVLVLDEVTSSLDIITAGDVIKMLGKVNREFNTSMLFISHDIALADRFCHRTGVMKDGRIVEIADDLTKAKNEYTRELVDSSLNIKTERKLA